MDDPHGDLRCPACRWIDWFQDGFVIVELADGRLDVARRLPETGEDGTWSCAACGHEVPALTLLAMRLDATRRESGG